MSVLYLHFEGPERDARAQKLARSGARVVMSDLRWPGFHELAKKEKPYAIAIDFSQAPSHCLETADYLAKAKETRETPLYLLNVPEDRLDIVKKRLAQASIVTEEDLAGRLAGIEREAQEKARQKREAAAEARRLARAKNAGAKAAARVPATKPLPPAKPKRPAAARALVKKKPRPAAVKKTPVRKRASRVPKKK